MVNKFFKKHWDLIIGYLFLVISSSLLYYYVKTCTTSWCEISIFAFFLFILPIFWIFILIATIRNFRNEKLKSIAIRHIFGTVFCIVIGIFLLWFLSSQTNWNVIIGSSSNNLKL